MARRLQTQSAKAVLLLSILTVSALAAMVVTAYPARGASDAPPNSLLYDDFTHDTSLNLSLWQINGPVGTAFGPMDVGFNIITLVPSFSSAGMEIAQINQSQEVGTIQSNQNFTPPFTVSATVEGTISNGHTFGFAITTANASRGVLMYGNLNPTNCSNLGNCGNPSTCGTPANSAIPPNQCYYGVDAKVGNGTAWPHHAKLYLTPSTNVTYTLEISVDALGNAQYVVSLGGQVLGQDTAQVGTGPFFVILEQGEGAPVAHPGPNQAYWKSVSLTPGATTLITSTLTTSTQPGPSPAPAGLPWFVWVIILLFAALFFIIILWYRRRGFIVRVLDSRTKSPIPGAGVTAKGPEKLAGTTDKGGKADFGRVDEGEYTIEATASGYTSSTPVTFKVKGKTEYTLRLDRGGPGGNVPPDVLSREATVIAPPSPETQQPLTGSTRPPREGAPPAVSPPGPAPPPEQPVLDLEGFGGPRMRQIIRTFQEKGAISPETALTADELGLSRLFVRIMKRRQGKTRVFMEVNGKYYLDQKALEETR